ncbi:protein Niban 2 [Varanus komodoensis]|uniref:protein Niban 2 n=1 Tax=Varanus komodoensis TaxID=61221 RepID=UPI001CF7E78F|nr:protein Niban 2 [Varanus komodoensis]
MGDVVSAHLDDSRRQFVAEKTGKVLTEFCQFYEQQYGVALFNSVRYEIEGGGGPQPQLLRRKVPLEDRTIFSGNLFQYLEENKKWRNRFSIVPHNYGLVLYENKLAFERGLQPRILINSAGYKVLTSLEEYLELVNSSLPGPAPKSGNTPILKCPTQFPLILWHPFARHYYFCVMTGKEQEKWLAIFQDCARHCNNGLSEDSKVEVPAFTDAVRMYRQSKEQYGTWDMLCGNESQILSNLVMEELLPELKNMIGPRLKGKAQERHRVWIQVSDAVYRMVHGQTKAHYDAALAKCELQSPAMRSAIRTDMDQVIQSREHLASKIRASVSSKAEVCVRNHVQPYITSILEALMIPTSQGFAEVREVFFKEVTDLNMNIVNEGGMDKLGEYMEKLSQLAFHPVKMQSCYEKMELLKLEGLQQRFDVSSASVFKQRAQILMRQQMDDTVYTFETLLHQELGKSLSKDELCKTIQRILERVLKKYDYDSSTVRKKFFREALLQITVPFLLKKLAPTCKGDLARFQELIFEDFASFILVENTYEEVVLQSVMKDIMMAVKEAAVQRKHNLYRDSIAIHNSDPDLHLLAEGAPIDWGEEFGGGQPDQDPSDEKQRRAKQVVSVIHVDEGALPYDAASLEGSPEPPEPEQQGRARSPPPASPGSPGGVKELRTLLVTELPVEAPAGVVAKAEEQLSNGAVMQESPATTAPLEREEEEEAAPGGADTGIPEDSPEGQVEERGAAEATPASPCEGKAQPERLEPSDKETGEEAPAAAAPLSKLPVEPPQEDSHGAAADCDGVQTQF